MALNDYHDVLEEGVGRVINFTVEGILATHTVDGMAHWEEHSEWVNASIASVLVVGGYGYGTASSRWHRSSVVLDWAVGFIDHLVESSHGGRWYHLQPRMGDRNVDRFTLIPFIEALRLFGDDLPQDLRLRAESRLREIFEVQYVEYGHATERRIYPNMDVYYCLAMYYAADLTGEQRYADEFERTLRRMEGAQFPDGGWAYIDTMNESPGYHGIDTMIMARIAQVTGHQSAVGQMKRSVPYYPLTVDRQMRMEFNTDCWWKHPWEKSPLSSWGPDAVASLTGDGQNRWLGDQVRERTLSAFTADLGRFDNAQRLACVYSALFWQDVEPQPIDKHGVIFDRNIEGPRGFFEDWSWSATARNGCDTVVGALAATPADGKVSALMGVMVEIPVIPEKDVTHTQIRNRWSKGAMPPQTAGATVIDGASARFRTTYRLASYATNPARPEQLPRHWLCEQDWTMDEHQLAGSITVRCLLDHESALPIVRVRLGLNGEVVQEAADRFRYEGFVVQIEDGGAFPVREVVPARSLFVNSEPDAWELVLRPEAGVNEVMRLKGEVFSLNVRIKAIRSPRHSCRGETSKTE